MRATTFDDFQAVRYWPQLDGLRVVSIALVLVAHMADLWVPEFQGALGVIVFFVISGFLITSLLIREESRKGKISLSGFYIRRVFRIAPMYYLALGCATVLVLVFGFGEPQESYLERLPWLATFNGDLVGAGTFVHAWSIGIEEKFYILWPLLAFALIPLARRRLWIAMTLLAACTVAAFIPHLSYFGIYTAILAGCVLAILMHNPRTFQLVAWMAHPATGVFFALLAVVTFVTDIYLPWNEMGSKSHVLFAYAVVFTFPSIILGGGALARALSWKPLAFVGTRTYGIYLFHVFAIDAVNRVTPDGETNPLIGLARLIAAGVLSFLIAEVLYRTFEQPMIQVGRRLTGSRLPERTVPANGEKRPRLTP